MSENSRYGKLLFLRGLLVCMGCYDSAIEERVSLPGHFEMLFILKRSAPPLRLLIIALQNMTSDSFLLTGLTSLGSYGQ